MRRPNKKTDWDPIEICKNVFAYLRSTKISRFEKFFVIALTLVYVISPIDVIPDVFFPFGALDDIGVLLLVVSFMNRRVGEVEGKTTKKEENDDDVLDVEAQDVTEHK